MDWWYPVDLVAQPDGRVLVSFPDVPEALTDGATTEDALAQAVDCLVAALGGYIALRRDLPAPSRPRKGQRVVPLPALIVAKLLLYRSMREAHVTGAALGRRLGLSEGAIRRLLDLDHRSHLEQVDAALRALGKRLLVDVRDAA